MEDNMSNIMLYDGEFVYQLEKEHTFDKASLRKNEVLSASSNLVATHNLDDGQLCQT